MANKASNSSYLSHLSNMWMNQESDLGDSVETHCDPNIEINFFLAVANGDIEIVEKSCQENCMEIDQQVICALSKNAVTNLKYHLVMRLAVVTRMCAEAGMQAEYAFSLSDFYIQQLDGIMTEQGVIDLHNYAMMDFTKKMRMLRNNFSASKPVNEALNYIYKNIKNRITIEELAEHLNLSKSYLSRLFKKEVGISVSDYIREQKVERAKNLLRNSDFSFIEIANNLAFSSQSHFIQIFKSTTGMTPKEFRDAFYQTHWKVKSESGAYEMTQIH